MTGNPLLLVDIGNSSLKWSLWDGQRRTPTARFVHRGVDTNAHLDEAWGTLGSVECAFISNVAGPEIGTSVVRWLVHAGIAVRELGSAAWFLGVRNGYKEPAKLGIDRWLGLIAVDRNGDQAICTVDCGSAITLDGICPNGQHLGGAILPGFRMVRDAFERETRVGLVEIVGELETFARDTQTAVCSGLWLGCASLIARFRERLSAVCRCPTRVVLTGSDAHYLLPYVDPPLDHEPDLVIRGLEIVARNYDEPLAYTSPSAM